MRIPKIIAIRRYYLDLPDYYSEGALPLADILSSLSYALDLTSGYSSGHAQRTCLIGLRLASVLGLPQYNVNSLYHALLMKDAGCSSNSARMAEIFGTDDIQVKRSMRTANWSNTLEAMRTAAANVLPGGSAIARLKKLIEMTSHREEISDGLTETRCDRGAQIALQIGLGEDAALVVRHLDEHWDGHGSPYHLKGDAIPLLARIACLAQTMDVFYVAHGVDAAYEVIMRRCGTWFDPELVRAAARFKSDYKFWGSLATAHTEMLSNLEMRNALDDASEERIDAICSAFAGIVDAKSPFTAEHSSRVRDYAVQIGQQMGIMGRRLTLLRRAAQLHDLGKLGVPNSILDKPGKPTPEEWAVIREHPRNSFLILARIRGFDRLAEIAGAHHERLDGNGYHRGIGASELDLDMRILAAADVFDALSAKRPYRDALPLQTVYEIMDKDAGAALDPDCISALKFVYPAQVPQPSKEDCVPLAA